MSLILRPYQEGLIAQVKTAFRAKHRGVLIQLPTGGGKTATTASLVHRTSAKGNTAWFLVHRRELIKQSMRAFDLEGIPFGVIAAGMQANARETVQIGSIGTVINRMHRYQKPKVLIFDECHHLAAGSWRKLYQQFPEAKIIGLSATPSRTDGQGMQEFFDIMVCGPSMKELIAEGYLSPFRLLQPEVQIDVSAVHVRMGDYNKKELEEVSSKPTITGDAIAHYKKYCEGGRNLIFAVSVKHSIEIVRLFNEAGYPAIHLDGETDDYIRDKALEDFERGKILHVSNVELFGEGFDCPTIECLTDLAPTKSIGRYLQRCGRALRPTYAAGFDLSTPEARRLAIEESDKPYAILLDHAGNSHRFGAPDEDREWSLMGRAMRQKEKSIPPPRICPGCYASNSIQAIACAQCGMPFQRGGREVDRVDGTLSDADKEAAERLQKLNERIKTRKQEVRQASTREQLVQIGRDRGYRFPEQWADYNIEMRTRREKVA